MALLPVAGRSEEIAAAIAAHQVLVLCGETGSGKTTQLPQICLAAGRGTNGMIGHTQPRRLAARSVALRLAEETGTQPGTLVAYKVRFSDQTGPQCRIKLMTDGILLQELRRDRQLRQYDTLIIDEAHERSVNIDFLLGYLQQLLPQRPELRLIIMSATIEPEKFSAHFSDAPILEISGRTYPVEIRYQPPGADSDGLADDIVDAVVELRNEKISGDMLAFLPGERDIRDAAAALRKRFAGRLDIVPLYARLAAHQQDRVFSPGPQQRVVLATNVAETSITVPRIAAVIDSGLARISRYSHQSKIQRLPIEPISRASAQQRAGRCGRVQDGICIRLYSEPDYQQRDAYTDPEILRVNLAQVLLRMADLELGDIGEFPFPDPPDERYVRDGLRLLAELQAIDETQQLTRRGRTLARLAVDPRFAAMLVSASEQGCLKEMLVIVAALGIADPADQRDADEPDPQDDWRHPRSELMAYLQLWTLFHQRQQQLSANRLRKWCRRHGLAFLRLREWQDIHRQLRWQAHQLKLRFNKEPASYKAIHLAALTGLLSQVGQHRDGPDYRGARGLQFRLVPNARIKRRPPWIVAATIQQTGRAYASQLAAVQPAWIERGAGHLVRRSYSEPYWESTRQRVYADETVSLYGLTLRAGRAVDYTAIDPPAAMRVFTREGLARGLYSGAGEWRVHNAAEAEKLRQSSARLRRTDLLPDIDRQAAFFRSRMPAGCGSPSQFERWREKAERKHPRILYMDAADMTAATETDYDPTLYPDYLQVGANRLVLDYRFAPSEDDDGVSVMIPLAAVGEVGEARLDWLVPGLLDDKVTTLLRGLPKSLRRHLVPIPNQVTAFVDNADTTRGFYEQLAGFVSRAAGRPVRPAELESIELPPYLRMRIVVVNDRQQEIATGRSLRVIHAALGEKVEAARALQEEDQWHREQLCDWPVESLPRSVNVQRQGVLIEATPGLEDTGSAVRLRLFESAVQAGAATRRGSARLVALQQPQQVAMLSKRLQREPMLALLSRRAGGVEQVADEIVITTILAQLDKPPATRAQFNALRERVRGVLVPESERLADNVLGILRLEQQIRARLEAMPAEAARDIESQLQQLVFPGFIVLAGPEWLLHYPRYLSAIERRLDALQEGRVERDRHWQREVSVYWQSWLELYEKVGPAALQDPAARRFRFMIEEYRVSLFAQALKTAAPVSARRLDKLYAAVTLASVSGATV